MLVFAAVIFFVTLAALAMLFALNIREERTGSYALADWRVAADAQAVHLKELMAAADLDIKKVPPLVSHFSHVALHFAALEFAHLARQASRQAHRLADFVSHKHNFQRRQTRSEFLKKMSEHKNGNGNVSGNGHEAQERVEF